MSARCIAVIALILLAITSFYGLVLFGDVTIQWDAVSYFYPYQKHFSDSVRSGKLPAWTSAIYSGFPFLSDLQVGAWYPFNWPFFLAGITPKSIFGELWLHACLAAIGAYLLGRHLELSRVAAAFGAISFSLSGFFAAHSQHVCLFQAAAWLPTILYLFLRTISSSDRRCLGLLLLSGGALSLTGHFQTVMYVFTAVVLSGFVLTIKQPRLSWPALMGTCALLLTSSTALAAVQIFPSAELLVESLRSRLAAETWNLGIVEWASLATFVYPNAAGTFNETYTGPIDISQHYFYAGVLLLPLSLIGLRNRKVRLLSLCLVLPPLFYSLGPTGLLYELLVKLPGFSSVRAPSHSMFIATLGLALLAAAGAQALAERARREWLILLFCGVSFLDLYYWNMLRTRVVYANGSYEQVYGPSERWFRELVTPWPQPLERLGALDRWEYFYPAVAPFDHELETTFGSNALMLTRYYEYLVASNANPSLMAALGVSVYFGSENWTAHEQSPVLPRFYFPPRIVVAPDERAALQMLRQVDPVEIGVITEPAANEFGNASGDAEIISYQPQEYVLRVSSSGPGIMRIAVPWYPGWHAEINERPGELFAMDHALMGLRVPKGKHTVRVFYRSNYLQAGAAVSLLALCGCVCLLIAPRRAHKEIRANRDA